VKDVARYFDTKPKTVYQWVYDGYLTAYKTPGGGLRFSESEVRATVGDTAPEGPPISLPIQQLPMPIQQPEPPDQQPTVVVRANERVDALIAAMTNLTESLNTAKHAPRCAETVTAFDELYGRFVGAGFALATHPDARGHKQQVAEACGLIVSMIGQDEAPMEKTQ
jgi:excisionase family DNA binding protein